RRRRDSGKTPPTSVARDCSGCYSSSTRMSQTLDPQLRRALAERIRYYNELGIYDFYRRESSGASTVESSSPVSERQPESREEISRSSALAAVSEELPVSIPESAATDPAAALRMIREDIGDCTRCVLHKQGRKQIVFGVGNPNADLMFIGEAPGADE